jgi:hypothetical protein
MPALAWCCLSTIIVQQSSNASAVMCKSASLTTICTSRPLYSDNLQFLAYNFQSD